ncbi:MAG: tRNA-dihydrouridine synthase [Chromatiales bacterium]|nr:tRNA-dihydrouridine synthase [Chromatiales bacterium]
MLDRRVSVAPMMDWTDRHCRFFLRLLTRRALLYTEMVTTGAVLRGDRERLLAYDSAEHPLAAATGRQRSRRTGPIRPDRRRVRLRRGESERAGCPSDRVQSGRFGACLMAEPALVAACVAAMRAAVAQPITVNNPQVAGHAVQPRIPCQGGWSST